MSSEHTGANGLAERYANALFELAEAQGALAQVASDLAQISALIDESADLRRMLRSPVIARDEQWKAMEALLQQVGVSDLVRRFVGLIAANRRLFALPDMIEAYATQLATTRGEVKADVTAAQPLSDAQHAALVAALEKTVGKTIALHVKVDPGLLGGLVVKVGSRMVDSSIRTKLQYMRLAMKGFA